MWHQLEDDSWDVQAGVPIALCVPTCPYSVQASLGVFWWPPWSSSWTPGLPCPISWPLSINLGLFPNGKRPLDIGLGLDIGLRVTTHSRWVCGHSSWVTKMTSCHLNYDKCHSWDDTYWVISIWLESHLVHLPVLITLYLSKEIHQFGRITKREISFVTNSSLVLLVRLSSTLFSELPQTDCWRLYR